MSATITAPARTRRAWQAWALAAVELFVAYQAVSGGIGLITDSWQLPVEWLLRTPFQSWVGPGWVLIGLVGVPHVVAAVPPVLLPTRPRLGVLAGYLAGASLVVWIAVQLALLTLPRAASGRRGHLRGIQPVGRRELTAGAVASIGFTP